MPPKKSKAKSKVKYEEEEEEDVDEENDVSEEDNEDEDEDDKNGDKEDDEDDGENNNLADEDDVGEEDEEAEEDDEEAEEDDDDVVDDDDDDDAYLQNMSGGANADNDDENNDENDEDNYKKITKYINKDELLKYHPECIVQSYDEIRAMTDIQLKSAHVTIPLLTKYERARIIGMRTVQLNNGATPLVEVPDTLIDNTIIAEKELVAKKIPFILCRPLPDGRKEYWKLEDLEIL